MGVTSGRSQVQSEYANDHMSMRIRNARYSAKSDVGQPGDHSGSPHRLSGAGAAQVATLATELPYRSAARGAFSLGRLHHLL